MNDHKIFYVKTNDQACQILKDDDEICHSSENQFTEEGWYQLYTSDKSCPEGCCYTIHTVLRPVAEYLSDLHDRVSFCKRLIEKSQEDMDNVQDIINGPKE